MDGEVYIWCDEPGEVYQPFAESPAPYLAFASLAEEWWFGMEKPAAFNDNLGSILKFVENYGLLRHQEEAVVDSPVYQKISDFSQDLVAFSLAARISLGLALNDHEGDSALLRAIDKGAATAAAVLEALDEGTLNVEATADNESLVNHYRVSLAQMMERGIERVRLKPLAATGGFISVQICHDLLSVIWLELFHAAIGNRILRQSCPHCGLPFAAKKSNQKFCSQSCRHATAQRAYVDRKKASVG